MNLISLIPVFGLSFSTATDSVFGNNLIQMFFQADLIIKFVLIILVLFSIISWAIIFVKWRYFQKARNETVYFLDLFWDSPELSVIQKECNDLIFSPVVHLFKAGYTELKRAARAGDVGGSKGREMPVNGISDSVERALNRTIIDQGSRMEKALVFLATTGNTAPFMGLFGTIWGIMEAFRGIGLTGSASLAVIAPGIADALVTTAIGLIAAIPAVIAYNYFSSRVNELRAEMDTFAADFLSLIARHPIIKTIEKENK